MKPARIRRNREELRAEALANFAMSGNEEPENPFEHPFVLPDELEENNDDTDMADVDRIYPMEGEE